MLYLTETAEKRIKKWTENDSDKIVRISIKTAGCTGLMYEVVLDNSYNILEDHVINYNGISILVENKYLNAINGATLDYVPEGLNSHFELIDNPNEKAKCGCGESFSI